MFLVRFSVNNPVLVNMMVVVTLVGGAIIGSTLVREMFPETRPNQIAIMTVYPATQPVELERAVTIKIEEAVRDVEGVEKVNSSVSEGISTTILTLYNSVDDADVVLQEVKSEVDALTDLPDDIEQITISKVEPTLPVIMVAVFGEGSESELKRVARGVRDDLLKLPGVSDVQLAGLRDDEISVEVKPAKLLEYDITFDEVASAIRETNLDVSGGSLKGDRSQVSVRLLGEELHGADLLDLEVRALPDGRVIRLGDVAVVEDGFVETDVRSFFSSRRSANLIVEKTADQDAIQISQLIKAYVAGRRGEDFRSNGYSGIDQAVGRPDPQQIYDDARLVPLEPGFDLALHTDLARFVEGRLDLMLRNGKAGLILVLVCLMLFLNWRVAIWTAVGLPVSFLGTFIVMSAFGVSINLLSLFGLIIVLGIIVDDAIVIGENIYRLVEEGVPARQAAWRGAEEVMWPVVVAVATTIAAFSPLLFVRGQIGDFMRQLPLVVIAALTVSLLEALTVLPAHLRNLPSRKRHGEGAATPQSALRRIGQKLTRAQEQFMKGLMRTYETILVAALRWRYIALAIALATCMTALGLFLGKTDKGYTLGNIVQWEFVQKVDAESMFAQVELPIGSNSEAVEDCMRTISDYAVSLPEVATVQMDVAVQMNFGQMGAASASVRSHVGQIWVELHAADEREAAGLRSSQEVLADLRELSEGITGVNSITWEVMNGGPIGKEIEIRVTGEDYQELRLVCGRIQEELASYNGVVDLDDNDDEGRREVQIKLRGAARPTGITRAALGSHVRAATFGAEARRLTRNREDVRIMVRYPRAFREDVYHIESMWVPAPRDRDGRRGWIPMRELAELNETRGFTQINRSQQQRAISVYGDIDAEAANANDVMTTFKEDFIPLLRAQHPAVTVEVLGAQEEQAKGFGSLMLAAPIALLMVYLMLAALFKSYAQPLVVMSAIPFGIQGAIFGHWLIGMPMTFLSAIGMVALTGIVVNDSLILVEFVNRRVRDGFSEMRASIDGATLRLRPILLTTCTTVAGLTPMMFEKSFQAKFLIPMAVTLTFGLIFATVLTLLIVPVLNMIFFDVRALYARIRRPRGEGEGSPHPAALERV